MTNLASSILTLAEKDVRLEIRSKETLFSSLLFVLLSMFIFNFSFTTDDETIQKIAPGILWVVIAFSGTIVMQHLASRDHEDSVAEGLLLTGLGGTTLFCAKFIIALLFMTGIEAIVLPMFVAFFNFDFHGRFPLFAMVLVLGTIGYSALGTLFATMLTHARLKGLLLPIVFYPAIIPLLLAAVRASADVFDEGLSSAATLLIGFDIIFLAASALLFEFVVEDPS